MKDGLDELLDHALAGYAGEPRVGLEQRVMRRVRSQRKLWPFALPVFAVAASACWILVSTPSVPPPVLPVREVHPAVAVAVKVPNIPRRRAVVSLPKQQVFPSPAGLSDGERALLALVQRHPEAAEVGKRGLEPIETQPLEIRLLQTEIGQ